MTKFLTPSEVPEEVVCRTIKVPNSLEWLGIFNAVLLAGTYPYNWSDDVPGNLTREEAAAAYSVIFYEYLTAAMLCDACELPTGTPPFRVAGDGTIQQLIDGAWQPPEGDYTIPPVPEREGGTAEDRLCLAAMNAANVLADLYEAVSDQYTEEIDPLLGVAALLLAVGIAFAFPFAPIVGSILLFLELPFAVFYFGIEAASADLWNADFTDKLTCVLLRNATEDAGVITFDLEQIVSELGAEVDLFDPTVSELRLFGQVDFLLRTIGADGLNHAGATTAITEPDCELCDEGWCYKFDFTVDDGGWAIDGGAGTWVSGDGWQVTTLGGTTSALLVGKALDFPNSLRSCQIWWSQSDGDNSIRALYYNNGSYQPLTISQSSANGTNLTTMMLDDTTTVDIPNVWFNVSENAAPLTMNFTLHAIEFRGDFGANPFGEDNCGE